VAILSLKGVVTDIAFQNIQHLVLI
jgi:hypothetical protein